MKKKLLDLLKKKEARKQELGDKGNKSESVEELRGINTEIESLNIEIADVRSMIDELEKEQGNPDEELRAGEVEEPEKRNMPKGKVDVLGSYGVSSSKEEKREKEAEVNWEERGSNLYEKRAVTVSSGDLVLPKHTSANIKGTFNQVSTLVDRVSVVPLQGGESYDAPYEVTHGEGNYTVEGAPYVDVEQEFGYATINKTKITSYQEITEEVLKLPRANYGQKAVEGVRKSLRKKIAKEILNGAGPASNQFVGIFSAQALAINPATDIAISAINEDTLDEIIYSYGGDEDVEDEAVLIISKDDLRQFSKVRLSDGKKAYAIVNNGNTGTIDGVQYIINSGAGTLATAATGDYLMAYGPLSNYEMAVFSGTDIKRSEDVKFKEGMIAHRGSIFAGGNVVSFNGFLRVKKEVAV